MKPVVVALVIACGLWLILFSPWTQGMAPFWPAMVAATGLLAALALWLQRRQLRTLFRFRWIYVPVGIASATALYGVFWLGRMAAFELFDFAQADIRGVYDLRAGVPAWLIAALLVCWIGPAEEIFWRGLVQKRLADAIGPWPGYLVGAAVYAGVHAWSGNFMLIVAAGVCGVFWGWLFKQTNRLWPVMISHAAWDVAVFILWPLA